MTTTTPVRLDQNVHCDVERGPNWLFVRLHPEQADVDCAKRASEWANELMMLSHLHLTYRLVVEMDELGSLSEEIQQELSIKLAHFKF